MIIRKKGVSYRGIRPEIILTIPLAYALYQHYGIEDLVITSVNDGEHGWGSKHYNGEAIDFRIHNVPENKRDRIRDELAGILGRDYDVLRAFKGEPREHYHVEFQPKSNRL